MNELKHKLKAIEETGIAYEKEVENMRKLRGLYEERTRAIMMSHQMEVEREKAKIVVAETKLEMAEEKNRELMENKKELQERIETLDATVDKNNSEISDLRIQLAGKKEELYNVTSQMAIVNNLFTQLLADPESLDRVTRVLEEHHDLVNHLTEKGNITDVASVLMTVADRDHVMTEEEQDIASNLSKVWRLLVELLGHHNKPTAGEPMPESCYKSVDTPSGPKLVISVSQTFLRLKDLILEKNCLVKEVGRLKDLNTHLAERLISQETRLAEVAEELHKTWGVVNKLKTQHKALHTHEQVLRYELKQKRLMLNQLKQQMEECKEMWQMARDKNSQTEKDWAELRKEFADRKQQISSAESGYEESPGDSQDEEDSHKLSDDESDMQDFSSGNKCLTIRRLQDSEQCTPDRSNTPELLITEESNNEDTDTFEPPLLITNDTTNYGEENISDHLPGIDLPNIPENVQSCTSLETGHAIEIVPTLETLNIADVVTLEVEPTIEILPWNDSPDQVLLTNSDTPQKQVEEQLIQTVAYSPEKPKSGSDFAISEVSSSTNTNRACSSSDTAREPRKTNVEEMLARREARMKRLEEQCQHLFNRVNHTNKRSDLISSKLVELHEHYGEGKSEPSTSEEQPSGTTSFDNNSSSTIYEKPLEEPHKKKVDTQKEENKIIDTIIPSETLECFSSDIRPQMLSPEEGVSGESSGGNTEHHT